MCGAKSLIKTASKEESADRGKNIKQAINERPNPKKL